MRLAIFLFVCFAASTAVNSTQTNYSGANNQVEQLRAIPSDIPRLPPNNSSMIRRLRQVDQPDWCKDLRDQSTEEVLTNCKELRSITGYVLRIDKDVNEEAWKKFVERVISIQTNVEIADSPLTELIMTVRILGQNYLTISNNSKLESIFIKGKERAKLTMHSSLAIKENAALKTITIEAREYRGPALAISENDELETIELNTPQLNSGLGYGKKYDWAISNNPKLHHIHVMNVKFSVIITPLYIVGNEALIELKFPETMQLFVIPELVINNNDKLETIEIPQNSVNFKIRKLEIKRNKNLTTIDVGKMIGWNETELIVQDNPCLSTETKDILKKTEWKKKDIQGTGGDPNIIVQPAWCLHLQNETAEQVIARCKTLGSYLVSKRYVLRIDQNVSEEAWKKFIGNLVSIAKTDVEIIDSSLTEVILAGKDLSETKMTISNNPKLETVAIKGKEGSKQVISSYMDIKGNSALKSIKIEAVKYNGEGLTISDNSELETIEYNVAELGSASKYKWTISNNPKLRRIQLQNTNKLWIDSSLHIVGNKALTELKFPESVAEILVPVLSINDNDNLESIKLPEKDTNADVWMFRVDKLEIRQNDKLKTIDVGEEARWKNTNATVRENPLLSSETLETLKKIEWRSKNIQDAGEQELLTTTAKGTVPDATSMEGEEEMETNTVDGMTGEVTGPTPVHQPLPPEPKESKTNNTGLIVGCVAIVVAVTFVGVGLFLCMWTSKKEKAKLEREKKAKKENEQYSKSRREEPSKTEDTARTDEPSRREEKSKTEDTTKESASGRDSTSSDPL